MKTLKHSHRGKGKANKVPRSATFNGKGGGMGSNQTYSSTSKRKK